MRRHFRNLIFCIALLIGSVGSADLRPDQIEELFAAMNQTTIVHTVQREAEGDPPGC